MQTNNQPVRRVTKSFAMRLEMLEKLEANVSKGKHSAWLEQMVVRDFGSPARAQASQVGYKRKNPAISNFLRARDAGLNTLSAAHLVTAEGDAGLAPV